MSKFIGTNTRERGRAAYGCVYIFACVLICINSFLCKWRDSRRQPRLYTHGGTLDAALAGFARMVFRIYRDSSINAGAERGSSLFHARARDALNSNPVYMYTYIYNTYISRRPQAFLCAMLLLDAGGSDRYIGFVLKQFFIAVLLCLLVYNMYLSVYTSVLIEKHIILRDRWWETIYYLRLHCSDYNPCNMQMSIQRVIYIYLLCGKMPYV